MQYGDKVVVWTDLHLGLRNNERLHNTECKHFVKWMINEAKAFGANKSIFCGDFHHYRSNVQCNTLNYSVSIFKLLSETFDAHYQIVGNHDLFYKNKREINSMEYCREMKNIHLVDETTTSGIVTMTPWLVKEEFADLSSLNSPYIFAHLELPNFYMNSQIKMPENFNNKNSLNAFQNKGQQIFSGHFHKRQSQTNKYGAKMTYIGNCFPHDFSDAWDDERGIMLLEFGKEPIFKSWPESPKYRTLLLSELLTKPKEFVDNKTKLKVSVDIPISQGDLSFIKETMVKRYKPRELSFLPYEENISSEDNDQTIKFVSIDQIIIEHLLNIESNVFESDYLIDIYKNI